MKKQIPKQYSISQKSKPRQRKAINFPVTDNKYQLMANQSPKVKQQEALQLKADQFSQKKDKSPTVGVHQLAGEVVASGPLKEVHSEETAYYLGKFNETENPRAKKLLFIKLARQLHPDKNPGNELAFKAMHKAYKIATRGPVPEGSHELLPLSAPKTSKEVLSDEVGVPIDERRDHMIPTQIHRFWSGGKMSDHAMEVLRQSAGKTHDTMFQNNLWFSSELEKGLSQKGIFPEENLVKRDEQRVELRGLGYNVRDMADIVEDDPRERSSFEKFRGVPAEKRAKGKINKSLMTSMVGKTVNATGHVGDHRWDGLKHFSDMARLMYLEKFGGHHLDVDMGLGKMDLSRPYYHNDPAGNVPLMGAVTAEDRGEIAGHVKTMQSRDSRAVSGHNEETSARAVGSMARDMSGFLNGMIATKPENPHVQTAIEKLIPEAIDAPGMMVNKQLLYGDRREEDIGGAEKSAIKGSSVPPYLLDLEHLTAESGNR